MQMLRVLQAKLSKCPASYLAYCFLIPVVLTYLLYLAMEIHPFGNGSVLVLDLNAQYVYFFEALRNFVHGDASLLYSFCRGLGGEFVGIYAYYLASPLSYLVALFPTDRMLEALLVLFMLKSGLCGVTFGFYLHKHSKHVNRVMVIAFSTMYALCAYAVIQQNNTMWIDALIWLPLLTYGIEQLVSRRRFKLFVIALAVTIWSNYYIGYMVCFYVVIYFFYYYLAYGEQTNPLGEKRHLLRSLIRTAFFSLLAVAIAGFIVLGAYYSLTFGKSTFSNPNWALRSKFDLLDFFTKFLPGSYDTVRPEGLPFVYTGILTLLLVPIYFVSKKIPSREKVASLGVIVLFVLCFIASPLDLIWHGFQNPNWLNHRYSFMLCFLLLVFAYKGFANLRRVSEKFILGITAFLILFVAICEKQEFETYVESDSKLLTFQTVWLTVLAAVVFFALLCLLIRTKNVRNRENIAGILAAVVCIELYCSSLACMVQFDGDVLYSKYDGYNDFLAGTRVITEQVLEGDTSFYRMEKNVHRKVNDNMALKIRGLSNSTSTLNSDTIDFMHQMGYASQSHWSQYQGGNPVNDSLLGIKYIIDEPTDKVMSMLYEPAYSSDKYIAYRNPNALSVAYGVEKDILSYDMDYEYSHFERMNGMVTAMLGSEERLSLFLPVPINDVKAVNCSTGTIQKHRKYEIPEKNAADPKSAGASVTFTTIAPTDGVYYFYAPTDYARDVKIVINGANTGEGNNHIQVLGYFKAGDEIAVKMNMEAKDLYLKSDCDYFYYLDQELFEQSFSALAQNPQFVIEDGTDDDTLIGSITTAQADQTILTTIPFDKGWKVYLDGKELETYETLDALIAFDIPEAGAHTLEMRYRPTVYRIGMFLTLGGSILFVLLCVTEFAAKRKLKKHLPNCYLFSDATQEPWVLEDFDDDFTEEALLPPPEPKKKEGVCDIWNRFFPKKKPKSDSQKDDDNNGGN